MSSYLKMWLFAWIQEWFFDRETNQNKNKNKKQKKTVRFQSTQVIPKRKKPIIPKKRQLKMYY